MRTLLPPSATPLMRAFERAAGPVLPVDLAKLADPWRCPAAALPWLAWALHVTDDEGWRLAATEGQRRALIARSILLHRSKGTPASIRNALTAIGFADAALTERLPAVVYDGAHAYAGAETYASGGRWAMFKIEVDLGEDRPFNGEQRREIVRTVNAWKPASRHLYAVEVAVSVADALPPADAAALVLRPQLEDAHLPGARYDGRLTYSHGAAWAFSGATRYSGRYRFGRDRAAGQAFDNVRDPLGASAMALALGEDVQRMGTRYDAVARFDGASQYGLHSRFAVDEAMPIRLTRHRTYNGRARYAGQIFNAAQRYGGAINFGTHRTYSGPEITYLEAA